MNIGLTGGIATGKSTVAEMLKLRGAIISDADVIAREVVAAGSPGLAQVVAHFGKLYLRPDGTLDRIRLGERIFQDKQARSELNHILHPLIMAKMQKEVRRIEKENPDTIIVWDIPLLYEEDLTEFVEKVIVVYVAEDQQIKRLMLRNNYTEEEATMRVQSQMSIERKKERADFVIDNQGTLSETERQVDQLWNYLILKNGSNRP
ncbi:dephospho-CoA kinase [Hazenella sp. IB182357]|uniref:Dephospho-CoA kinase n=1 Tax=Polycladospora coralii TaxID=2771432 RepID=A0A926RUN6_9BACL|nr:dephospho-CoA kinase [Polycladospora coralii]MBD1372797.1 dephospho-CoA kinase [Polycladospora coralii]MBS7529505.1 dephospho-CoA kinase [Polycladospora coralii]